MSELATVSRVTIYAAKGMEEGILRQVIALGAKGYTAIDCKGVGDHGSVTDPFMPATQVRIEVICLPASANKIIQYIASLHGKSVIACEETVHVANASRY
jgi:hypothetical protein